MPPDYTEGMDLTDLSSVFGDVAYSDNADEDARIKRDIQAKMQGMLDAPGTGGGSTMYGSTTYASPSSVDIDVDGTKEATGSTVYGSQTFSGSQKYAGSQMYTAAAGKFAAMLANK